MIKVGSFLDGGFNSDGFGHYGLNSSGIASPGSRESGAVLVWLLSSADPQLTKRGIWVDAIEVWEDTSIWYD